MPKYYCDYCDTYLTHDSPSVRKTHCSGRKHKENVRLFYQKWLEEQVQKLVDDTTAAYKAGVDPKLRPPIPGPGGAMIPPPGALGPRPMGPPAMGPMMGPPRPGGPMQPMVPMGMRPQMGPQMGPPTMMMAPLGMRPPMMAGPQPRKPT